MATDAPLKLSGKHDFKLPIPPPLLHTRSGNEIYQTPGTPTGPSGFTSPPQTPQGSPSKNRQPPGANDLPNVFENAMKLMPPANGSPSKANRQPQPPNKNFNEDPAYPRYDDSSSIDSAAVTPGSPTRHSNKENTSPGSKSPLQKTDSSHNQAAANRQAPYKQRDHLELSQQQQTGSRGPSPLEWEKLQKPSVKRLANITQLCKTCQLRPPTCTN